MRSLSGDQPHACGPAFFRVWRTPRGTGARPRRSDHRKLADPVVWPHAAGGLARRARSCRRQSPQNPPKLLGSSTKCILCRFPCRSGPGASPHFRANPLKRRGLSAAGRFFRNLFLGAFLVFRFLFYCSFRVPWLAGALWHFGRAP